MLHRKYRRKVVLPYINFTNTQFKTANTQLVLLSRVNTQFHRTETISVSLLIKVQIGRCIEGFIGASKLPY